MHVPAEQFRSSSATTLLARRDPERNKADGDGMTTQLATLVVVGTPRLALGEGE
jgi:hypothetical protein